MIVHSLNYSGELTGYYKGAVTRDGSVQLIDVGFYTENGEQKGKYFMPEAGLYDVPAKIENLGDSFVINIYYGNFLCYISKDKYEITGISEKWDPKIRIHLKKSESFEKKFTEEEITFNNGTVTLTGTLFKPLTGNKPTTYVALVHGSDYQDRNTPYYRSLGYILAESGIGVLLYDKRGCGKSSGNLNSASFGDLAEDAASALEYLKNRSDLNIYKSGLLGTSQGGWISSIAANKTSNCDFMVLNVGPAVSLFEQDINRVEYSLKDDGWDPGIIDSAVSYTKLYFEFVKSGNMKDWSKLENFSQKIKSRDWAEYVNIPVKKDDEDIIWWRLNSYDPAQDLVKIKCPVLSIFGGKDVLVPPAENHKRMDSLLALSGCKYKIEIISGCAHDMMTYQGLNGQNWKWPEVYWQWRKQPAEYSELLINWIKSL